jgi:cyclophilin family peptidyl-prolyl cis-trans isomerase
MTTWQKRLRNWAIAGAGLAFGAAGCGKSPAPEPTRAEVSGGEKKGDETPPTHTAEKPESPAANFNQSFEAAAFTEVLEGHHLPPDVTAAGLKTGPLRLAVEALWPKVKLTDAAGRPVPYVLRLETGEGSVEITLRPELAPNHVRNFLALAHACFYDGLFFDRNVRQEADVDGKKSRLEMLIAGCPTGTGDDGFGHVGYFLRAEFRPELKHEAGTVGFWHEEEPDSAGCRFYVTLGPAPALDGKFTVVGKVTRGLDVLQAIAAQPVQSPDSSPENEKPARPVQIKKVTITPPVMEKAAPVGENDR